MEKCKTRREKRKENKAATHVSEYKSTNKAWTKTKTKTNLDLVFSAVRNWVTCDYVGNLKTGVVTTEKKINTYYWE